MTSMDSMPDVMGDSAQIAGRDIVQEAESNKNKMSEILAMLQGGLEALRTAELSRDEVYRVEDMCMDIKRELYEAERRGRC